ncbi:MAG TPA: DUF1634 domain-containing protein [Thermoanaerobaculia bacterium]|nr:DUF1634 domain-containing protein [Thermoanaerobaculia bacterium]
MAGVRRGDFAAAAWVLRGGVVLSAILLGLGLADAIVAPDPVPEMDPGGLAEAFRDLPRMRTGAMIHLGLFVLMLTPIARVVAVGIELASRRETTFVLMCVGVLFLLGLSFWIAR